MNVPFRSPITLLAGALLVLALFSGANASQAPGGPAQSFDRALLHAADRIDAAANAKLAPGAKTNVPDVRLPPAPLSGASSRRPSLDQWMRSELGRIREEKSGKTRAHELKELAASLRRAARPGVGFAPAHDPHNEAAEILRSGAYKTEGAGPAPAPRETLLEDLGLARKPAR
jgi:hypothetical protein